MARIVVTGGAGFLGSHLCERLLDRGDQVVCIDNLKTGDLANVEHLFGRAGYTFVKHDVSEYVWVPGPVDGVFHLASPASPKDYLEWPIPTLKVGSLGTHNTLGLALAKGARYFLASTSEVYGDPLVHPQTEDYWGHVNPVGPRGVYDEAKRFAEAMTMAYHRSHDLDVRIVRIFNSILADEQVLYDDGRELRREPVGDLAHRLSGRVDLESYSVPAFDEAGRIEASEATALVGHPTRSRCFEVRTRYGRSIRVTGDHSLFIRGAGGQPVPKPVNALSVGDLVAIARRVDVPERDRAEVDALAALDETGGDPWSVVARGRGIGEEVWRRRFELHAVMAREHNPGGPNWRSSLWTQIRRMRVRDQVPVAAARILGMALPADVTLRPWTAGRAAELTRTVSVTDELLWLLGLYVAEGCWQDTPHDSFITISGEPELLDRAAKVIERELDLHVVRSPGSAARSASLFVHSQLLLRLLEHLGFGAGRKRIPGWILGLPLRRLGWFLEGYREGDGVHSGQKFEEAVRHEFSTTSDELKDDLVVAFARFGLVPSVGRYETTLEHRTGDRRYPFWRLTLANVSPWSPLDWADGVEQRLNARCTEDLVWARVDDIVEVPATPLVYDFCVPGRENFWAGTGVMAHNTYGPRMRPRDGRVVSNFIVQAINGEPLTIYGDGKQTRSFCYVDDEISGLVALFDSDHVGPMNVGNPIEFTMTELANIVLEVTGSSSEIVFEPLPVDDPTQRKPDITLARDVLGWEPVVELREGVARTVEHFRSIGAR